MDTRQQHSGVTIPLSTRYFFFPPTLRVVLPPTPWSVLPVIPAVCWARIQQDIMSRHTPWIPAKKTTGMTTISFYSPYISVMSLRKSACTFRQGIEFLFHALFADGPYPVNGYFRIFPDGFLSSFIPVLSSSRHLRSLLTLSSPNAVVGDP